jgi:hypothetical protein
MRKRQPSDWAATVMVVDVAAPARSSEALPFVWDEGKSRGWRGSISWLKRGWVVGRLCTALTPSPGGSRGARSRARATPAWKQVLAISWQEMLFRCAEHSD